MTPTLNNETGGRATRRRAAFVAFSTLAASLALVPSSYAADASFSLETVGAPTAKPYFVFDGNAGSEISGRMRVINTGGKAGGVALYGVDATTGQTSGPVYGDKKDARREVGRWLSLGTQKLTLAPRKSKVVDFTVRVPSGTNGCRRPSLHPLHERKHRKA